MTFEFLHTKVSTTTSVDARVGHLEPLRQIIFFYLTASLLNIDQQLMV